jgi:starch phosphorylase
LTDGILDGANIEIRDRVGADNFILFGLDARQTAAVRGGDYQPGGTTTPIRSCGPRST